MTKAFDVENVVFCDYAAQEVTGKLVWAGIYLNEVRFCQKPEVLNLHFVIVLTPHRPNFKFDVRFIKPSGKPLIAVNGEHTMPVSSASADLKPVTLHVPIINAPFTEEGNYSIEIRQDSSSNPVYKKTLLVRVGHLPSQPNATIKALVTIGPDQ